MKVRHVLYFVVSVIALLGLLMLLFPKDGVRINKNWVIYFPSFEEFFFSDNRNKINTDSLLQNQIDINEVLQEDLSFKELDIEELKKSLTTLEFPENNNNALDIFYAKLSKLSSESKIRIMHYGDSQIEGDRITAFLRNKFQSKFGGYGTGFCSPVAIYSQFSIKQSNSANWLRYNGFAYSENYSPHKKYGAMIAYNRFAPISDSLTWKATTKHSAWLEFSESDIAYPNTKKFRDISIFYGNSMAKTQIIIKSNGETLKIDSLNSGDDLFVYTFHSDSYLTNLRLEFEGYDSPDFYTISFEDNTGIYIDNIALRGSSGTVFTSTDASLLAKSFSYLGVDLFILQFGGNTVPYIEDKKGAEGYANSFYYQITFLKSIVPDACFIVIGPSDMSLKIKDDYTSYPNLENIINELKKATHRAGGVYWDMYKAMGGKNSMVSWVNANPQLAGPDYVHFTPQGTSVISNMFYNALIINYTEYLERVKNAK